LNKNNTMPYMKSLATCLNKMIQDGYTEDFIVSDDKLKSLKTESSYKPQEVKVTNFFPFRR
jgi:hypothetical protein